MPPLSNVDVLPVPHAFLQPSNKDPLNHAVSFVEPGPCHGAVGLLAVVLAMAGCGAEAENKQSVAATEKVDWSKVKLILGDQAEGSRSMVEASKASDGIPYQVEWANFQGSAPLFEALRQVPSQENGAREHQHRTDVHYRVG